MQQIMMKKSISILALAVAVAVPSLAAAQQSPPVPASVAPSSYEPTQAERDSAKAAALSDLGAEHRANVLAIVDRVNSGQLTDFKAAQQQIAVVLSPAEVKSLLAERGKMLHLSKPDPSANAAQFLLRIAISPEKLRELRLQIQEQHRKAP